MMMKKKLLLSLILVLAVTPVSGANRLKVWAAETLTFADLNAEINNVTIGTIDRTAGRWGSNDDIPLFFGTSQDARLEWDTAQTTDSVLFGLGSGLIFSVMELADMTTDWGIASQTNPTLFVHSADATATTDYIALSHNQTNATILAGGGSIDIQSDTIFSGTTPLVTIGDGGAEDAQINFNGNETDFSNGLDDSTNSIVWADETTLGTDNLFELFQVGTGTSVQRARFYGANTGTPTDNDETYVSFFTEDDANTQVEIARMSWVALDVSAADDDSRIEFDAFVNNTFTRVMSIGSKSSTGTDIELLMGDGGAEDTQITWIGNAVTFAAGLDDTADSFVIGLSQALGTNPAITITGDGTEDITLAGDLTVSGTGPHAFGKAVRNNVQFDLGGSFTSGGATTSASSLLVETALTGVSGDTSYLTQVELSGTIATQNVGNTIVSVSTLRLIEPVLTANDTVTSSAILVLAGAAATEAGDDYGLLVDTANVRFGAVGTNDGHVHILSPATGTTGLIVEVPTSSSVTTQEWHYNGTRHAFIVLSATTIDLELDTRDLGDDNAGATFVIGRNSNGSNANSGALQFVDVGGATQSLWVDNSDDPGDLRIVSGVGPSGAVTDTSGTIVGTQASPRYVKNILHEWTDDEAYKILDQVLATPVYDFIYKSGKYNRTFTGIAIEDGEEPWYGYDRATDSDYVPEGTAKALNIVNGMGYMILSFRALNQTDLDLYKQIKELQDEVSKLRPAGRNRVLVSQ